MSWQIKCWLEPEPGAAMKAPQQASKTERCESSKQSGPNDVSELDNYADSNPDSNGDSDSADIKTEDSVTDSNEVPVLRRAAMDGLARREHSLFELQSKLQRKFPDTDPALIRAVLEALQAENLQSDERFAESYTRYRKSRGFGYLHIKADLKSRRVSDAVIDAHLFAEDEDWLTIASDLVERKLPEGERLSFGSKQHRRLLRFLETRGFPQDVVRQVVDAKL